MDNNIQFSNRNPKETANCFSKLFFIWFVKLCKKSGKKKLNVNDLYLHQSCDASKKISNLLEKNWKNEIENAQIRHKNPSLFRAIRKTFFWIYMLNGLIVFLQYAIIRPIQPILLSSLIKLFTQVEKGTAESNNFQEMCIYGGLILLVTLLIIFIGHHNDVILNQIGMRVRIACCSLIYRKLLRLSYKSLDQSTAGQVINLLSNDVNRFDLVACYLHHIWVMPILTAIVAYCIWLQIGVSALAGIGSVLLLTIPVHGFVGKLVSKLRLKIALRSDSRIRKMAEIISGIQVIKMYAWEKPFAKVISIARSSEIEILEWVSYLRGIILSSFVYMQRLILLITLFTYVSLGHVITAEKVFSMSLFFNLLQLSMAIFYPLAISLGAESWVSIDRLEEFLMLDEKFVPVINRDKSKEITLKNIYASWTTETKLLKNISMQILPGSLCAVVGPVGAGKSSLLQLLLGELIQEHGDITVGGDISYSSQEPWLFASSVRKNILFGQKYDRMLYKVVVNACALKRDFELLPQGDQTLVGERGVSLSGGQKARINLARAVYRNADIYLLDDPLSAVDTHVGKQLFQECILGYLKNKTRILITHQLQYLKKANHIIVVNDGKIEAQGSFSELLTTDLDFTKILVASNNEEERKETPKDYLPKTSISIRESLFLCSMSEGSITCDITNDEYTIDEEAIESVSSAYWKYAKTGGNICVLTIVALLLIGGQVISNCSDFWITYWTSEEAIRESINSSNNSVRVVSLQNTNATLNLNPQIYKSLQREKSSIMSTNFALMIFSILTIISIMVLTIRSLYYYKVAMNASKNLHNEMFSSLLQTPMRFFDTNPSGRILNRFSRDMGMIDEILPRIFLEAVQLILILLGVLVMICITNPYMIIVIAIVGIFFGKLRRRFVTVARDLKHLEGIMRSPVFSHVSATINGMTTIRASKAEVELEDEFDLHQDSHTSAWYLTIVCISSFGVWIDLLCFVFIFFVIFGFIFTSQSGNANGSYVGLAVSQVLMLTGMVQYGIRQTAEVASQMTSVERVLEYTKLEKEGPQQTPLESIPMAPWPNLGRITFSNVYLRYSVYDLPVLKQLNFKVEGGEKIGIVGRTGAGKSSLISALFRLAPVEGSIIVDDVDTSTIGLNGLRKKMSIIPQEPVLFSATLRYNLDPFGEYTDAELWKSLGDVELRNPGLSLDFIVQEGGSNFSVGQRQLLCLARAILRNNRILILDEATANVDPQTDALIQRTIRSKFKTCTVLTIAHRLHTIMDADKVLVMDAGMAVEYDHPHLLLQNPTGYLSKMVSETSPAMELQLRTMAENSYSDRDHFV